MFVDDQANAKVHYAFTSQNKQGSRSKYRRELPTDVPQAKVRQVREAMDKMLNYFPGAQTVSYDVVRQWLKDLTPEDE